MHFRIKLSLFVVALAFATSSPLLKAQAKPAAIGGATIDAFGLFNYVMPDWGEPNNKGFTVGGDYMFFNRSWGQIGVNGRYNRNTGTVVNESFFGGGLDYRFPAYRFLRPYIVGDYGLGSIKINSVGLSDSGSQLLLGGGVDIPVKGKFYARGEVSYNFLSIAGGLGPDLHFTPISYGGGLLYRIR